MKTHADKDEALLRFHELVCEPAPGRRVVGSGAVPPRGILRVRGPSGAGKSTLLRALARLVPIASGEVWLEGRPMETFPVTLWRRRVHYSSQRPVLFEGTVLDNVLMPFRLRVAGNAIPPDRDAVTRLMEELGLADPDQDARTLSGGEQARVALVRAVLADPRILLLDEPTAALDPATRRRVLAFLGRWVKARPDRGLVLVSHLEEDDDLLPPARTIDLGRVEEVSGW